MAVVVDTYDKIIFYNGKFLELPRLSQFTFERNKEYVFKGKCVVFAAEAEVTKHGSNATVWRVNTYGVPVRDAEHPTAGWTDLDGHEWYVTYTRQDSATQISFSYTLHIGSTTVSAGSVNVILNYSPSSSETAYNHNCYILWAYRRTGQNNTYFGRGMSPFAGAAHEAINGKNDFINIYQANSQFTWDNYPTLNVNYANRGLADAYNFNPYYRDFGYIRLKTYEANNNGFGYSSLNYADSNLSISLTKGVTPEPYDDDPNKQGGNSKTGGGHGNFDRTSDTIQVPSLPTLNSTKAGVVTLYKPSLTDLVNLAEYLWSSNIINILIQYFSNPMDIIIGLGIVPVDPTASTSGYPSAGSITVPYSFSIIDSQYYELDCGTITLQEFWGSALDYAPYTQVQIYLPYIGVRELNVDEIMGKAIGVKYHIDLFGGACVAFVTVGGSAKYQFSGNCLQQIPVNAANYDQLVQNLVSVACVVGSGIAASGSAGVAAAVGSESAALGAGELSQSQAITKGLAGAEYADVRAAGASEWMSENGSNLTNCVVSSVMGSKPRVERTGALAATTGQLCTQTPYLIITRPEQSLPNNYKHYEGYPSNITSKLGSLSGFTKVESIRLNDLAATQPELMEIYSLLYKGVII